MRAVKEIVVVSEMIKVIRFKELKMPTKPLQEGEPICTKNPYFIHYDEPGHICTMELEEVLMSKGEYKEYESEGYAKK